MDESIWMELGEVLVSIPWVLCVRHIYSKISRRLSLKSNQNLADTVVRQAVRKPRLLVRKRGLIPEYTKYIEEN
jgi:hypothetical protein